MIVRRLRLVFGSANWTVVGTAFSCSRTSTSLLVSRSRSARSFVASSSHQPTTLGGQSASFNRIPPRPLQGLAHRELTGLKIDGIPPQAQAFAEPQPKAEPDRDECLKPMAGDSIEQGSSLSGRQRLDLPGAIPRRIRQGGRVARYEFPPKCLIQRGAQPGPRVPRGPGARPILLMAPQPDGDVVWRELGEPHSAETRNQVGADDVSIARVGPGPQLTLLELQPTMQVVPTVSCSGTGRRPRSSRWTASRSLPCTSRFVCP